jgi:hypothetical protein
MKRSISISSDDSCFVRARKLLQLMGLVGGDHLVGYMAEGIEAYKKLDEEAFKQKLKNEHS